LLIFRYEAKGWRRGTIFRKIRGFTDGSGIEQWTVSFDNNVIDDIIFSPENVRYALSDEVNPEEIN
jgi:hypothetical protein